MSNELTVNDIYIEDFESYESVRESGVTNMMAVDFVSELAGISKDAVFTIMMNYGTLSQKYADGWPDDWTED